MTIIYLIIFLFGLTTGSFLNCVIYRLAKGESFVSGRSYCPHCQHTLAWYDLIPVLSFFVLGRRCRYCKKPIALQYPIVEISTALIFLLVLNFFTPASNFGAGSTSQFLILLYYWIISAFLIIIFVYDLKYFIIPDKVVYPAILLALIFNFFTSTLKFSVGARFLISSQFPIFRDSIISAVGAAAFFLAIVLFSRGKWMGFGDVKLAFLMGLILSFPNILVALFLAFFIGAIIGLGLIIRHKKTLKSEVPFGPFLITGTFLALFWGERIINWYLNLFI